MSFRTLPALSGIALVSLFVPAVAQVTSPTFDAPPALLEKLGLRTARLMSLTVPQDLPGVFTVDVVIDGRPYTLELTNYSVFTHDFELWVDDGVTQTRLPTPEPCTYQGTVRGVPGSVVNGGLIDGQLEAEVTLPSGRWTIEPASPTMPALPHSVHVISRHADVLPWGKCGVEEDSHVHDRTVAAVPTPLRPTGGLEVAEISIDANYSYYLLNNSSVTTTTNRAATRVGNISWWYERDINIRIRLKFLIVRTAEVYGGARGTNDLLNRMRARWNSQSFPVERVNRTDTNFMLTGDTGSSTVGTALQRSACNRSDAFGAGEGTGSTTRQNSIMAHELGHQWSAGHCNGTTCFIMCSSVGGCSGSLSQFAPVSVTAISNFAAARNCTSPPQNLMITNISPPQVQAYQGGTVTVTGSDLDRVNRVRVGNSFFNTLSSTATQVTFQLPDPFEIKTHNVTVSAATGTSNTVTIDVIGNHPSAMDVPATHTAGTSADYKVRTDNGWIAVLFVSPVNLPSLAPGLLNLGIGASFAQLFPVSTEIGNNMGIAQTPVLAPNSLRGQLYWQAVTVDPNRIEPPYETSSVGSTTYR